MPHFPLFIDLTSKPVLIVGGGNVALRKLQKLLPYEPVVTMISPVFLPEIKAVPGVILHHRPFFDSDLRPARSWSSLPPMTAV